MKIKLLDSNIEFLQRQNPHLLEELTSLDEAALQNFTIQTCQEEGFYLEYQQTPFNSRMNSFLEAERFILNQDFKGIRVCILFGLELGYRALSLLKHHPSLQVIVLELRLEVIARAFSCLDFSAALNSGAFSILTPENPYILENLFKPFLSREIKALVHRPSFRFFEADYEPYWSKVKAIQKIKNVNQVTIEYFQDLWIHNILTNLKSYLQYPGVEVLFGSCLNQPIFIIGAGASIEEQVEEIKQLPQKGIVIAATTVLNFLLHHGVCPHILIAVDPQSKLQEHFFSLYRQKEKLPFFPLLVVEPTVNHLIVQHYPGKVIFTQTTLLQEELKELLFEKGMLDAGGSVLTAAFSLAHAMGGAPIVFFGLDLSFTGSKLHFQGSELESHLIFEQQDYFNPIDTLTLSQLKIFNWIPHPSNQEGEEVFTDYRLLTYKTWFENKMGKLNFPSSVFNTSKWAVRIDAISYQEAGDLLSSLAESSFTLPNLEPFNLSFSYLNQWKEKLATLSARCHKIFKLTQKGLSILANLEKQSVKAVSYLKELDQIDLNLLELTRESELFSVPMQKAIRLVEEACAEEEESQKMSDSLENSRILYQALSDTIQRLMNDFLIVEKQFDSFKLR